MKLLLALVLVGGALYGLHRAALWAEDRGWLYYRRRRPSRSALGNAFLEVQAIVEPGKRVLLEARQEEAGEEDGSGDPPDPADAEKRSGEGSRG